MKKLYMIFGLILSLFVFASCGSSKWDYTKDDMANFINIGGSYNESENKGIFKFDSFALYKDDVEVTLDDVLVFDIEESKAKLDEKHSYISYDIIKETKRDLIKVENVDDTTTIEFNIEAGKQYACLINKELIYKDTFVIITKQNKVLNQVNQEQLNFEKTYVSKEMPWEGGGSFVINVISQGVMIGIGASAGQGAVVASGVINLLTPFINSMCSTAPTIADVLNRLDEMDKKLDNISEKLDRNHDQLMDELTRTEAMVDQVLLSGMEGEINSFVTEYQIPISNFNNIFADHINQSYRKYVKEAQTIDVFLKKNSKGEWDYVFDTDKDDSEETITITINDFKNSKEFLKANKDIPKKGFVDKIEEDISDAISGITLPSKLSKEALVKLASAKIVEEFTRDYFSDHAKALEIMNLSINLAKRIAGIGYPRGIVETYFSRLKYMFNFKSEMYESGIGVLANLLNILDTTVGIAAEACEFESIDSTQLEEAYLAARHYILDYYKTFEKQDNNYSFITNKAIKMNFYDAKYDVSYTNPGNNATFHAEFVLKRHDSKTYSPTVSIDDISIVSKQNISRIRRRMELLQEIGYDESETFIAYLAKCDILPENVLKLHNDMRDRDWISDDAFRILTDMSIRNLTNSDSNLSLECVANGNPGGEFFKKGTRYNYRSSRNKDCWNGKIVEANYLSGIDASTLSDKKVCAYAEYFESRWYWLDDELHGFIDNSSGNYFFIIENVTN